MSSLLYPMFSNQIAAHTPQPVQSRGIHREINNVDVSPFRKCDMQIIRNTHMYDKNGGMPLEASSM